MLILFRFYIKLNAALKSLTPSKAPGPDMTNFRLLHHLGPIALNTLLRICNLSWSTMEIPQAWRVADVRPVLKAGKDARCLDSYRPISLTSTMGKVMERLVTNRLRYFAECHNLLTPFQAGLARTSPLMNADRWTYLRDFRQQVWGRSSRQEVGIATTGGRLEHLRPGCVYRQISNE